MRRFLSPLLVAPVLLTAQTPRPAAVTPAQDASAYADSLARVVIQRARVARLAQDSALRSYDAKAVQRQSIWLAVSPAPKKLLHRAEQAVHVRWTRESGVWIEPTGRRAAFPMGASSVDLTALAPVPYFPGRDALWLPVSDMAIAKAEVSETELRHPLAAGAEAYYRYASGDSLRVQLGAGRTIDIREVRITARRPDWRLFVGSFWFDAESGALVRAAYRLSARLDIWETATEETEKTVDSLRTAIQRDTGAARAAAQQALDDEKMSLTERIAFKLTQGTLRPITATISAVTVEFGLFEGRFWLPTLNVAEGDAHITVLRAPIRWEERFTYERVNGPLVLPVPTTTDSTRYGGGMASINIGTAGNRTVDTSAAGRRLRDDSTITMLRRRADSLRARLPVRVPDQSLSPQDSVRERELKATIRFYERGIQEIEARLTGCAGDSTYYAGTTTRHQGALRISVTAPCNPARLTNSPDLPGSILDGNDPLFDSAARDQLLATLDQSLQPPWAPRMPEFGTGLNYYRYNRIEGLSLGGGMTQQLGAGFTVDGTLRYGFSDHIPNVELGVTRSNGRIDYRLGGYRRLAAANDDWGSPLSTRASISNLLFGWDEGFYYRSAGIDLARTRADAGLRWRMFGERHQSAGITPNSTLWKSHLGDNIHAERLDLAGGALELSRLFGEGSSTRLATRLRAEGAFTRRDTLDGGYGRYLLDVSVSRSFGPFPLTVSAAAGTSTGTLPIQRAFFMGGAQTVRGQLARLAGNGRVGDAAWLTRTELGWGSRAGQLMVFGDLGWAGARSDFTRPGRPLSGVGGGFSLLDGWIGLEVSRGLWPDKKWRTYFHVTPRFR